MVNSLQNCIDNSGFFNPKDTVVIALSGGVDSMVLLDVLLSSKLELNCIIAHVNHKKRLESDLEYQSIQELAHKLSIPFEGYEYSSKGKNNFHNESRNQRYSFFKTVAQKYHTRKILLAHHLDDQVETILMRIVRGTSFSGYSGIGELRIDQNFEIIRPFLSISKEEIMVYALTNNITFYEDKTNQEDHYTRNRYRHAIIPLLKEENPNLDDRIMQFRDYLLSANSVLEHLCDEFLKTQKDPSKLQLLSFNRLEKAIKYKILTKFINNSTGNNVELKYEQLVELVKICHASTPNQSFSLGKNYLFIKEYNDIFIQYKIKDIKTNIEVNGCGEYRIDDKHRFIISDRKLEHIDTKYFELCYNKKVFPLYLRNRKNGDKINLSIGTKKVKDILIDKKVPVSKRNELILLAQEDTVLWIPNIKKSKRNSSLPNRLYIYEVREC